MIDKTISHYKILEKLGVGGLYVGGAVARSNAGGIAAAGGGGGSSLVPISGNTIIGGGSPAVSDG